MQQQKEQKQTAHAKRAREEKAYVKQLIFSRTSKFTNLFCFSRYYLYDLSSDVLQQQKSQMPHRAFSPHCGIIEMV